ncbi:MAG: 5-formyltetrahydrofolate cyclo-ligase [Chromatocurvus sp.]
MTNKQQLRRQLRKRRGDISPDLRRAAAMRAVGLIGQLPGWNTASRVAGYLALPEEFDCGPLLDAARRGSREIYLPGMTAANDLQFRRYGADDALLEGRFGIRQPQERAAAAEVAALDIMFLPLVGWNLRGTRLGMGAGFYDRTLAAEKPGLLVGLGYDCQEFDNLPRDPWDIALDYILTESRLVACVSN